jgi:threonine dehydratase
LRKQLAGILLVGEKEIVETMQLVGQRMKLVIEPSSAVALAPLLKAGGAPGLNQKTRKGKAPARIGIIVSGGNV